MIPADADFIASETSQTLRPYFDAYFSPYYYPTETADGTFSNCALTDGRIEVTYGSTSASWTSPIVTNPAEVMPATPTPTWDCNRPGYSYTAQYRTSNNYNQVSTLAWSTLTDSTPVSLYKYYQIKFTWTAIRAWVFKTQVEAEASSYSFYFVPSTPDANASYFCPGDGVISYLDDLLLTGEYQIDPDDVMDMGELSEELGGDFGKLVAGEHTMVLTDRDNKFTPGHANFIFKDDNWFRKGLRLTMGYQQGGTPINIFKGTVCKWGPRPKRIDPDCKVSEPTVEVYSKSLPMKLLEKQIGITDDDGIPHPWICGEVLHELVQLTDECPTDPEKTVMVKADFSATTETGAGNALTNNSTYKVKGMDSIKCRVETGGGVGGQGAMGYVDLALPNNKLLLSAWVMVKEMPSAISHCGINFMGFQKADSTTQFYLTVGSDTKVWVNLGAEFKETSWYLNQDIGTWKRVSLAFAGLPDIGSDHYGIAKIYVNGEEVFSETGGDYSLWAAMRRGMVGTWASFSGETWEMYFADIQMTSGWEPYAYRLYGAPYQSMGTIYQDGAIQQEVKRTQTSGSYANPNPMNLWSYFQPTYIPGRTIEEELLTKNPRKGLVISIDYANPPSGTLFCRARKDNNDHPADIIQLMLEDAGLGSAVSATSFAACKTAIPNDVIGCWFEDTTLADAISAVGQRCLINILATLDIVRLLPYKGVGGSSVRTITDWIGYDHSFEMEDITSRVKTTWGWYERNKQLIYIASDADALAMVGQKDIEIDLTWGQEVASDSEVMAKNKTDWLLTRVKGGKEILEDFANPYSQARIEVGDTVTVTSDDLFNADFLIISKSMKMSPDYELVFNAVKYLGEP